MQLSNSPDTVTKLQIDCLELDLRELVALCNRDAETLAAVSSTQFWREYFRHHALPYPQHLDRIKVDRFSQKLQFYIDTFIRYQIKKIVI